MLGQVVVEGIALPRDPQRPDGLVGPLASQQGDPQGAGRIGIDGTHVGRFLQEPDTLALGAEAQRRETGDRDDPGVPDFLGEDEHREQVIAAELGAIEGAQDLIEPPLHLGGQRTMRAAHRSLGDHQNRLVLEGNKQPPEHARIDPRRARARDFDGECSAGRFGLGDNFTDASLAGLAGKRVHLELHFLPDLHLGHIHLVQVDVYEHSGEVADGDQGCAGTVVDKEVNMPLIKLETSATVADSDRAELALALSKIAASAIGKPEAYVMASITEAAMTMAGEVGSAAFLDVRSIGGLNQTVNRNLTKQVCALLDEKLGIPGDRVYISFASSAAVDWGWNNSTFG